MNEQNEIAALKKQLAELVKEADNQRAADARIFDLCVEYYPHVSNDCPTEFEVECAFKYFRDRIAGIEREIAALRQWKHEYFEVEAEWNPQVVGKELGLPLGSSIRAGILPAVLSLKARAEKAEALVCTLEGQIDQHDEAMRRVTADCMANLEAARKAEAELSAKIDHIDLMVDELIRIKNIAGSHMERGPEIIGLCERGIKQTWQKVPVVQQRDAAQSRIATLEVALSEELSENRKLGISSVLHDFQAFAVSQQRRLSAALAGKGESKPLNQEFNCPPKTSALAEARKALAWLIQDEHMETACKLKPEHAAAIRAAKEGNAK